MPQSGAHVTERVCILGASSLRYMPYLRIYTALLEKLGIEYEIVYWDRHDEDGDQPGIHRFGAIARAGGVALIPQYFGFRQYVRGLPGIERFDLFIVLGMQIGVFLADFLRGRNYIIDIRDFTHENNYAYRLIAARVVSGAQMAVVSSGGFLDWVPGKASPVVSHNLPVASGDAICSAGLSFNRLISFIGGVRYLEPNKKLIRHMTKMRDWALVFHGSGTDVDGLGAFAKAIHATNVTFTGPFLPEEKVGFYQATDFVLCVYGNESINERTLLPNRLYEACVHQRPIIVSAGTYLADVVSRFDLGIVIGDDMSGFQRQLEAYYTEEVYRRFLVGCRNFLGDARAEDRIFRERFARVVGATDRIQEVLEN